MNATAQTTKRCITRPKGRVRIETWSSWSLPIPGARITRPKGRVRIETTCDKINKFFVGCITRPKGRVRIETACCRRSCTDHSEHHPAERPGAD